MPEAINLPAPCATVEPAPTIHVLPPAVTARIAAGEVVERPASVVKELVENALDAGAQRITVDLGGGGLTLVRVSDDGCGMNAADLALSVLEHATSKIRSAEELPGLTTLGFRGEALPSIASVSRFSITSRPRDALNAHRLELLGGEASSQELKAEVKPAAGAFGTVVEARELFFNLPARKKFMKGAAAEASACTDILLRLALTQPHAGFALFQDRREVFTVAPQPESEGTSPAAFLRRARELLGRSNTAGLLELDAVGSGDCGLEQRAQGTPSNPQSATRNPQSPPLQTLDLPEIPAGYRLYGLISPPAVTRANRSAIYLTVNGRPVKDRTLTSALLEAYRHLLPPKRYPVAVLCLELPGADVDANVHPTKTEVRFRVPGLVYALFYYAIRRACGADLKPSVIRPAAASVPVKPHVPLGAPSIDARQKTFDLWPTAPEGDCGLPLSVLSQAADCGLDGGAQNVALGITPESEPHSSVHEAAALYAKSVPAPSNPQSTPSGSTIGGIPQSPTPQSPIPQSAPPAAFRVLGQAGGSYIVLEDDTGVKLIDQHALHERVLFEEFLKKAHQHARGDSQGLLTPRLFDLNPMQAAVFTQDDSARELLQHLGFSVELFGNRAIAVRAVPAIFKSADKAALVLDVLDALSETSDADPAATRPKHRYSFREKAAYMLACKGALKAGERLTIDQMTALVEDYRRKAGLNSFTCPHGRPVALEVSWEQLEKAVGR